MNTDRAPARQTGKASQARKSRLSGRAKAIGKEQTRRGRVLRKGSDKELVKAFGER